MSDHFKHECVGNLHVHSSRSDGGESVETLARIGKDAGLDFLIFNDHDYMVDGLHPEDEGFHDGLLVLMGLEIGERYHHYLAFDLKEMVKSHGLSPQQVIDRVNDQGGFGFLAHPFEKGMPFLEKSVAYTWNDLSVTGYSGICLWNFSSRWKERLKTPFHALFCLIFKMASLKGPSSETLRFWDRSCLERKMVAIGGSDAHGTAIRWKFLNFTPLRYEYLLNSVNVHVLLGRSLPRQLDKAKQEIYGAMREGRLFMAHEQLGIAKGFRFFYVLDDGSDLTMGEEDPFKPGRFFVEVPSEGRVRLLRNGVVVHQQDGEWISHPVKEPGVYRTEVYRRVRGFGWRPWIFSNPIYLR
jgi:hypothetical protein